MIGYLWNAFISGILFFAYLLADSWWWIFGIITFILMAILESKEINSLYEDDERDIL